MNYIECFNRFRAANCLQPVFFRSWCALMLPGVEYCRRVPFAPSWRLDAARCGRIAAVPFAPSWRLDAARCGRIAAVPFAPSWRLDAARRGRIAAVHPFAPFLVPSWCLPGASLRHIIHIIVYHRF